MASFGPTRRSAPCRLIVVGGHTRNIGKSSVVSGIIRALPEAYQDLLLLRFVENLPHTEIAKIMNKSAEALRAMQYRALKALTQQFERLNENHSSQQGEER